MVIKHKVTERVFREKEEKITEWKEIFNEGQHNFYTPPEESYGRDIEKVRNSCRVLVRKSKGKRRSGKLRCRYEDNIESDALKG
jgi:hypothetical protein